MEELQTENMFLKRTVDVLSRRIQHLEHTIKEENSMLRSSIIQFKQDVQKQVSIKVYSRELQGLVFMQVYHQALL